MTKKVQSESERGSTEVMKRKAPQDYFKARTLENSCPILKEVIQPDMRVLDVGCGPGTITLDVARLIPTGSVVGIDTNEEAIEKARKTAAEEGVGNVEFRIGDAYSIDFADGSFDVTYEHRLFSWIQEPVTALKELARVTRRNGWVVLVDASPELSVMFPECPELARIRLARRALRNTGGVVPFFNSFAPHEVVRSLVGAGFQTFRIVSFTPDLGIAYPGSEYFEYRYQSLKLTAFWSEEIQQYLIQEGHIERSTYDKAMEEIEAWYHHPDALAIAPAVAGCGRVD
jgi:ubiquinone/menaquinone biosynthesis C-methylase UbiE